MNDRTRLSKTLAHVLRHDPGAWGLKLDEGGWVALADVVAALDGRFRGLSIADLRRLVRTQSKRRYEIEGTRIRALYGHSVPVSMGADPVVPPDVLYHGTTAGSARRITSEGLRRMGRQRVHLSADVATALDVGRRRTSNPIILVVRAAEAHQSGIRFWRPSEGVWLSDDLPASFISVRQS